MMKDKIKTLIEESIRVLQKEKKLKEFEIPEVLVEKPSDDKNGDYSTNIALKITKLADKKPFELSKIIKGKFQTISYGLEKVETVEPGFINFYLSKNYLEERLDLILKQKNKFGDLKIGNKEKVNVEFISANPTGPLTLGNGRGGFCGDVLSNVLKKAGYKVTKEYYINNVGEQIRKLGHSVIGDNEAVYKGKYIDDLAKKIKGKNPDKVGEKAAKIILAKMIKPVVKKMGIKFDKWFSEKDLYKTKETDKVLKELFKKNFTYRKDGALWFESMQFGDDKDRVLVRENGENTYFVSDIAYLKNKFRRGFKKLVFFLGADHYGYVRRLKAAARALGYDSENVNIIIMQLVRLFEKGKEVRMSKREGVYVTINELIDEVGIDVARFFFLLRNADSHFNFDMDLAKEKSEKNPVYYVQYAYVRCNSILRKSRGKNQKMKIQKLNHPSELNLIKQLIRFPEVIGDTAKDYQVQRIPQYTIDLADSFHRFYENCRVIGEEDKELSEARLFLIKAVKIVFENSFNLMGISSPKKM